MQSVFTVEEYTDHLHIYELSDDSYPSGVIKVAPERGGIPILFHLCVALADGEYRLAGKVYQMKDHGFARNLPWRITAADTNGRAALSLQLNSDAGTREVYPYDFEVRFTCVLRSNQLTIEQEYRNLSPEETAKTHHGF